MRLAVALDAKLVLFSWLDLLLFTNHTHIHRSDYLKHGSCSCTAAVLLLYTDYVTARTPRTHI